MSKHIGVEMKTDETEDFLQERGIGTLGLASGGVAYTFPIAYAYDEGGDRCFFRFIMGDSSKKQRFAAETERASLTVYEWKTKNQWRSAVLEGPIRPVADSDLTYATTLFSDVGDEAALETFNEPLSAYESTWYELDVEEMIGRGRFVGR